MKTSNMKFRNRETGEIINVLRHNERGTFAECINKKGEVYGLQFHNLFSEYERVIEDKTINWEQRRYEIAKAMLPTCLDEYSSMDDFRVEKGAEYAVMCADALIKELQKKGTDNEEH